MEEQVRNKWLIYRRLIYICVSLAITVGVMWYLLKGMSFKDLVSKAADMDRRAVLCFMFLSLSQLFFRTWRYQILLRNTGEYVGNVAMVLTTQIRNFFSDFLPARLGALSFIWVTTQRLNVPLESATSTFALAFLFDSIVMFPMILIALVFAGGVAGRTSVIVLLSVVMLALLGLILWALPRLLSFVGKTFGKIDRPAFKYLEKHLLDAGAQVRATRGAGLYARLLSITFVIRILKYGSLYLLFYAWMKQYGYSFAQLPVSKAFLAMAAAEFMASTPVSGIAGFGAYEGTWALTFSVLGLSTMLSKETGVVIHLLTQVWGYTLGVGALLIILLPIFGKKHEHRHLGEVRHEHWASFTYKLAASSIATLLIAVALLKADAGRQQILSADPPTAEEERACREIAKELDGRILFDSNRSGSFGIYIMNPDGTEVRAVIDTKRHEIYPSASPDGEWIAFASTSSLERRAPSDIWIVKIDGTGARKFVENGTFPSWSADGKRIYFERERSKLMVVSFPDGKTDELLPKNAPETGNYELVKPRVSHDGKWAAFISDRKGRWHAWIANLGSGETRHVGSGCEPAWLPDGKSLVWITGSKPGTCIKKYELDSGKISLIQDTPPPRPVEYYPSISPDGKYVLFSAAPLVGDGQHEKANYQLYIKSFDGRPAVRLTFDPYTNRWPSILPYSK